MGLGGEAEQRPVAVEAPRPTLPDDFQPGLVVTVQEDVADPSGGILVGQLDCLGAVSLDVDDNDGGIGEYTAD